jgi:hypothetical protein
MPSAKVFDNSTKVANYRQVKFPQNQNWYYQLYFKGLFENERTHEQRQEYGTSTWVSKVDAGTLRLMQNEAIRHAQANLGGSNWIPIRRISSHVIVWRRLTRGRKVQSINTAKWKIKPVSRKKRK